MNRMKEWHLFDLQTDARLVVKIQKNAPIGYQIGPNFCDELGNEA